MLIRDISVELHRDNPHSGARVFCPTAGANAATLLVFDFDDEDPSAWEFVEDGALERVGTGPYFDAHNITLQPGEVHEVIIVGTTKSWYCKWRLVLDVEVGKHHSSVTVDDKGKPFQTSGDPPGGFSEKVHWAWWEGGRFVPDEAG